MKVKIVSRILTFVGIGACARLSDMSYPAGFTPYFRALLAPSLGPSIAAVYLTLTKYSFACFYCVELYPGKLVSCQTCTCCVPKTWDFDRHCP